MWHQVWKEISLHLTRDLEPGLMEFTRWVCSFTNMQFIKSLDRLLFPPIKTYKRKLTLKNWNNSKACQLRKRLGLHCPFVLRTVHTCDVGCITDICICFTVCYSQNGNLESCCAQPGGDIIISHKISNHHVLKFSFREPQVRIDLTNDMFLMLSEQLLLLHRST